MHLIVGRIKPPPTHICPDLVTASLEGVPWVNHVYLRADEGVWLVGVYVADEDNAIGVSHVRETLARLLAGRGARIEVDTIHMNASDGVPGT